MILKRKEKKGNGEQSGSPKRSAPRRARDAEELLVERGPPVHRHARVRAVADEALRVRAPSNASSKNALNFSKIFANFWRARSRLYQNEILQENMRSTAFFKLYKICILLYRCNLKIFAKNRFEKTTIFVKIQQNNLQMSQNLQNVVKFQKKSA